MLADPTRFKRTFESINSKIISAKDFVDELKNHFTVLTEYNNSFFSVTPTLSKLIQTYRKGGFSVHWMEELFPDKSFEKIDPRAFHFASKFPLWHMFELKPI